MVREENQAKTYRLSNTVIMEIDKIMKEDGVRSSNDLFEKFILSYREVQTTSFKKTKKESDLLSKDLSIIKKDLSTLLYLNGTMGDFLSITEINEIEGDSLVNKSKEKVKRDIEKKQVNLAFKNN